MVMTIGHRGARNLWPENSLDGFRRTKALGVEGVELDIHLSSDGELMVIHDPLLDRTTEGTGPVSAKTAAELAATRLRDGQGEGVPTLDAVLDIYKDSGIELHLEIKTDALGYPHKGLEQRLVEKVRARKLEKQAVLTCFVPEVLETVRRHGPEIRVLASLDRRSAEMMGGVDPAIDRFDRITGCLIAVEKALLGIAFDAFHRRLGTGRLAAWVPNEPDEIAFWKSKPIRSITTDRPDLAVGKKA